jgi:dihydroneopterin aldolase
VTNSANDIIRIKNAVFYAYHGVLQDEQNIGAKFEVDVDLFCQLMDARTSDHLSHTVNYEQVYALMKHIVMEKKYFLIESVAHSIGVGILKKFKQVEKVMVRIRKPSAPVHGILDCVEVEITSDRSILAS